MRNVCIALALGVSLVSYEPVYVADHDHDGRVYAAGDILAARIASDTTGNGLPASMNGSVLELDIEGVNPGGTYDTDFDLTGNNEPGVGSKVICTVTSEGYTGTVLGTRTRTVYGVPDRTTEGVRKASPDQTTANEVDTGSDTTIRIALSDFIYNDDTNITCDIEASLYTNGSASAAANDIAVTNGSTLDYPKVLLGFATVPHQLVTGNFLLEVTALHRFAASGQPLAAVAFSCDDESVGSPYTATVTDMTKSSVLGVGNAATNIVQVYATTVTVSGFTDDDRLTCNAIGYPWIGDADSIVDSSATGVADPDERLTPWHAVYDNDADYVYGFAVVDATNGRADVNTEDVYASSILATGAYVSSSGNSYNTIWRALHACQAYVDATHASRQDPGGCTIYLRSDVATINWPGASASSTDLNVQETWATITKYPGMTRADATITLNTAGLDTGIEMVKFEDVTIFSSSGAVGLMGDSTTTDQIWIHNSTIDVTHSTAAAIRFWKVGYATNNTVTVLTLGFVGAGGLGRIPWKLFRGNAGAALVATALHTKVTQYLVLGNYNFNVVFQHTGNASGHQISDHTIVAFNSAYHTTAPWHENPSTATNITHGVAYVQNVVELTNASPTWCFEPDDGTGATANNVIVWMNTCAGARVGMFYNDTGSTPYLKTNASVRGNVLDEYCNKSDVTTTADGGRTGGWPAAYGLGYVGNHRYGFANTAHCQGEFFGLYTPAGSGSPILAGTMEFVDNASSADAEFPGDGSGNGNYKLGASATGYSLIPGQYIPIPYDLEGTARDTAGTGSAGAFEMSGPVSSTGGKGLLLGVGELLLSMMPQPLPPWVLTRR